MNLEELYFKNNFTKEEEKTNLNINKLNATCITSNNNTFSLDEEGNLVVKSITTMDPLIGIIYPIGAIYLSTNDINPEEYFGGNWIQIKEKFLLGCSDNYPNGTAGGEKEHTLIQEELPPANIFYEIGGTPIGTTYKCFPSVLRGNSDFWGMTLGREGIYDSKLIVDGKSQPHNNMPPYLAVYMWKRVA